MGVAVLIPWRSGCAHRERALRWVTDRFAERHPSWPILLGSQHSGSWCKATAVAQALARTDADRLVIADADVWVDDIEVFVEGPAPWVVPHLMVHRLDEEATDELIATGAPGPGRTQRPYKGHAGGGITILDRDLYERVPLDARFVGWGREDDAWALALRTTLAGPPVRARADLIHLFHPPQARPARTRGSVETEALFGRYRKAKNKPARMAALVEEARCA